MTKVEEIQSAIESLQEGEYSRLREWFTERDWLKWDSEINQDSEKGRLDFLIREAADEKDKGTLQNL